jgi:hypothetical protein
MKIKNILSQNRRDFRAIYECEHCGHTHDGSGYDDSYFHNTVVPKKVYPACGKTADINYSPLATKYPDGMQV